MIKLSTKCEDCIHEKVCRNKGKAESAMRKLSNMRYGTGSNDDYDWTTIMQSDRVDITFSCPDFEKPVVGFR